MNHEAPKPADPRHAFVQLVDLAAERVGGHAIACSDDFFASMDNLLKPGRGVFIEDKFTENGKWMDGWESRRKRVAGHDWCVIRLGLPGIIKGLDIDTNHFRGNYPEAASVEACCIDRDADAYFPGHQEPEWVTILAKSPLRGSSQNLFPVRNPRRFTHLRLNAFPDGGIARLRVHGIVVPDWTRLGADGSLVDLAAVVNGGTVIACSDQFFGPRNNLIMPGRAPNMGDGWETRRKRRPTHKALMADAEWLVIRLGRPGVVDRVEIDTNHFKGNFPESAELQGVALGNVRESAALKPSVKWRTIIPRRPLSASHRHFIADEVVGIGPVDHLRLRIFPDGGVSRLRVWCRIAP